MKEDDKWINQVTTKLADKSRSRTGEVVPITPPAPRIIKIEKHLILLLLDLAEGFPSFACNLQSSPLLTRYAWRSLTHLQFHATSCITLPRLCVRSDLFLKFSYKFRDRINLNDKQ